MQWLLAFLGFSMGLLSRDNPLIWAFIGWLVGYCLNFSSLIRRLERRLERLEQAPTEQSLVVNVQDSEKKLPEVEKVVRSAPVDQPKAKAETALGFERVKFVKPLRTEKSISPTPVKLLLTLITKTGYFDMDWENQVGSRWFNVIGIVVLVIGMTLFLGYSLQYMGPAARITIGIAVSLTLLQVGVYLAQIVRYTVFSKPLVGGGWALLYFTAYAAHNLDAAKIIEDPIWGLVVLLVVAAGMIAHSLSFRSQMATALSYTLGFVTLVINPFSEFTLVASAILAGSLVPILSRTHWYPFGLFGITITYLNHLYWVGFVLEGPAVQVWSHPFWIIQSMLVLYWIAFTTFDYLLKPRNPNEQTISIIINVANTVAFLSLSFWQTGYIYPEGHYFLAGIVAVGYILRSYCLRLHLRRVLSLIDGSVAIILTTITFPLKPAISPLSLHWLALIWLFEMGIILKLGFHLREVVFRIHAYLLSIAILIILITINLFGVPRPPHHLLLMTVLPAIAVFYFLFTRFQEMRQQGKLSADESRFGIFASYAASALLAMFLSIEVHLDVLGLIWFGIGWLLIETGMRLHDLHLRIQGYLLCTLSLIPLLSLYAPTLDHPPLVASIWLLILPVIIGFYFLFGRLYGLVEWSFLLPHLDLHEKERGFGVGCSYIASILFAGLLAKVVHYDLLALVWLITGWMLLETSICLRIIDIRIQGYILSALSVIPLLDLYAPVELPSQPPPIVSIWLLIPPVILGFYCLFGRLRHLCTIDQIFSDQKWFADMYSYIASVAFAVFIWMQLDIVTVALILALTGIVLYEAGASQGFSALKVQGHGFLAISFLRLFLANFIAQGEVIGLSHRIITVLPVVAMLYYVRGRVRKALESSSFLEFEKFIPQFYSYGAALLLIVLARFELGRMYAVTGWAIIGFIYLALGIRWRDPDFRIQSYLIAIITFWRTWTSNFYLIGSFYGIPDRIIAAVPVIICFYAAQFFCRQLKERLKIPEQGFLKRQLALIEQRSRVLFSLLGSVLLTALLYYEVSGKILTIAWAVEGLLLLTVGFLLRERILRLTGLALLMVCVFKVFFIDLSNLETLYRIFSFIVLGLILLLISFGYTRYRKRIKRQL